MNNDLIWVTQSEDEAEYYLSEVSTGQFILDVKSLVDKASKSQYNELLTKLDQILQTIKPQQ